MPSIAASELEAAIMRLKAADRDPEAIHAARKHFKKTRALLSLVARAARGNAVKTGQKRLTSVARSLAASRDADVAVSAAEALANELGDSVHAQLFTDLIAWLRRRRDSIEIKLDRDSLNGALEDLELARASLSKLDLRGARIDELLKPASETYRRGRRAMKTALETGGDEALHDWRKKAQLHWRHMRLLKEVSPKESKPHVALAHDLSDVLGAHHDLAVLRGLILANRVVFRGPSDVKALCSRIGKKQALLVSEAASLGERLYAEKPKAFLERLQAHPHSAEQKQACAA